MTATLCLMGPTASGKSALALRLARHYPIEIVTVDSAQIYRGMDIGTAKPSAQEQALVAHHLLDICDPSASYSAAQFAADARAKVDEIRARGAIPVLVGGTMLYFKALIEGLSPLPAADPAVRAMLEVRGRQEGWPSLHAELASRDPQAAARIHPNDPQRLVRALEVCVMSGTTLSALQSRTGSGASGDFRCVAVAVADRGELHARIAERFDAMLAAGFIEEVEALYQRPDLHPQLPSMRCVGYRQIWDYLAGLTDYRGMREQGVAATRQLAKRQLTWLRSWSDLQWLPQQSEAAFDALQRVIC